MEKEIINRVALSKLIVVDLEDYYPKGKRVEFDLKVGLHEGRVLREKEVRAAVTSFDWSQFEGQYVALICTTDAIVPAWAYMLVSIELQPYATQVVLGDLNALETSIYQTIISKLDMEPYRDKPVIIKGCSNKPVPENAYLMLAQKLKPLARSIMYGEACSSVPLFKKRG